VDIVTAAQALLRLIDAAGSKAGKYTVEVHGGQGVQVGDHNTQHITFNAPPDR
jgi:RIP homotypic interaction motif